MFATAAGSIGTMRQRAVGVTAMAGPQVPGARPWRNGIPQSRPSLVGSSKANPHFDASRTRASGQGCSNRAPAGTLARLRLGVAASVEHSRVPFASGIRSVLDVGASRGQFALFALERFPGARIVCFEPLPEARERLLRVGGNRTEVHVVALGARPGSARLQVSAADDSSSLLPIGRRQVAEFPGTGYERDSRCRLPHSPTS